MMGRIVYQSRVLPGSGEEPEGVSPVLLTFCPDPRGG